MGVDGIGKGGGLPPVVGREATSPPKEAARPDPSHKPQEAARADASEALEALRRGEIDRAQYLDARVDAALAHLDGRLPSDDMAAIRVALRDQLETDPVLVELVRRATVGIESS